MWLVSPTFYICTAVVSTQHAADSCFYRRVQLDVLEPSVAVPIGLSEGHMGQRQGGCWKGWSEMAGKKKRLRGACEGGAVCFLKWEDVRGN